MTVFSMLPTAALFARRTARSLSIAGVAASALTGAIACRSPKPGYLAAAPRVESGYDRQIEVVSTPSGAIPAPERVLQVELSEWKISLADSGASPGPVTLRVHNGGTMAHAVEIEGGGTEKRTHPIAPDSTVAIRVNLKPSRYEIYCPLASGTHKKMGMAANLAVRSEG